MYSPTVLITFHSDIFFMDSFSRHPTTNLTPSVTNLHG